MLLRRLTKHIKEQDWFAVALDFFIVVVGILIAFQITNWNEEKAERVQEIEYLSALERDINFSIDVLKVSITNMTSQLKAQERLYALYSAVNTEISSNEIDRLISRSLFSIEVANIRQVTFEVLKSSGQLNMIGSRELITALDELNAELELAKKDKNEDYQHTYQFSDPMLINEGDVENILISDLGSWHKDLPWLTLQPDSGYSDKLIHSRHFKNILLYKAMFVHLRFKRLKGILERYQHILLLIDAQQTELGVKP